MESKIDRQEQQIAELRAVQRSKSKQDTQRKVSETDAEMTTRRHCLDRKPSTSQQCQVRVPERETRHSNLHEHNRHRSLLPQK